MNMVAVSSQLHAGSTAITTVDGEGMWRAWKRGFTSNVTAFKDLIDNAVDSAFPPSPADDFIGRIDIYPDIYQHVTTGICLRNNCAENVPPLERVFVVYESSKVNSGADAVGENGVGLKQACAALSDLSFVLVKRSINELSFGVIAESLQMKLGVRLPSFKLFNNGKLTQQMAVHLQRSENADVRDCIARYGAIEPNDSPNFTIGMKRICEHFEDMNSSYTGNEIFEVILHRIRHQSSKDETSDQVHVPHEQKTRVDQLLRDIKQELPKTYLHIPDNLHFHVCYDRIVFKHWPQRLVEFSSFTIRVSPTLHWNEGDTFRANDERSGSYYLRVFCGFDAHRATQPLHARKECTLHLHSRKSGRLICTDEDARSKLRLPASGSDYCQGLTVIIDDFNGRLPLNPTKQEIAFAEERRGEVHKENLNQLVGAVVNFYYNIHLKKFHSSKTKLNKQVCSRFDDLAGRKTLNSCNDSHLTTFTLTFKKVTNYGKHRIRVHSHVVLEGEDTIRLVETSSVGSTSAVGSKGEKRKALTDSSKERSSGESGVLATTRRKLQSESDEEEVEEMRVPKRKCARKSSDKERGEEVEKKDVGYSKEDLLNERNFLREENISLKKRIDECEAVCGQIHTICERQKEHIEKLEKKIKKLRAKERPELRGKIKKEETK